MTHGDKNQPSRLEAAAESLSAERLRLQQLIDQLRIGGTGMLANDVQHLAQSWSRRPRADAQTQPAVSVILTGAGDMGASVRTLQSIADAWFDALAVEIVVVDDASGSAAGLLAKLPGIAFVRSTAGAASPAAWNEGAKNAHGRYLCFLKAGTAVMRGWLEALTSSACADASIGVAGPKILSPDGRLLEAGAVVWRDGELSAYGLGAHADDARYAFLRGVDYCSEDCLLVRRDVFEGIGGFDERFAHEAYAAADLCLHVRSLKYRVVFEPRSRVVRGERSENAPDERAGRGLREKWPALLAAQLPYNPTYLHRAALVRNGGETLLAIDSCVPMYDRDGRSQRLARLLKLMRRAGYNVVFLPDDYAGPQPYTEELQRLGIEVLYETPGGPSMQQALEGVLPSLDAAWICSRELVEKYAPAVRRNRAARIIYDTARDRYNGVDVSPPPQADETIEVPSVYEPSPPPAQFGSTDTVVFIGNYANRANADAAIRLCTEIMPLVWAELPNVTLALLGDAPTDAVRRLASDRVRVPGYVQDVAPFFYKCKVFAAPLEDDAQARAKTGQALSYGVPCVLTSVAAHGFDLLDGRDCLIANDAASFARAIVRLFVEPDLWNRLSKRSAEVLQPFLPERVTPVLAAALRRALTSRAAPNAVNA